MLLSDKGQGMLCVLEVCVIQALEDHSVNNPPLEIHLNEFWDKQERNKASFRMPTLQTMSNTDYRFSLPNSEPPTCPMTAMASGK